MKQELKRRRIEKKPPDEREMEMIIRDGVESTARRQNRPIVDPSESTIKIYQGEMQISRNTPQIISNARFSACVDIRMSWTMWIMLKFKEFQESEFALSRFCRACPHCGCCIEKIDGCDAMVCGRDALGLGCGKNFSWNGAPFYRANTADKKMPEEFNMVPPDKAFEIRHEIEEGIALPCDCCGLGIVGPKIQCLNCPSYTVCINCSTNTAYDDLSGLLIGSHHSSHVCKVIFEK